MNAVQAQNIIQSLDLKLRKADRALALEAAKVAELRAENAALKHAAAPFAHPDFAKILSGNIQGDKSILYARDNAVITIGDVRRLAELLK